MNVGSILNGDSPQDDTPDTSRVSDVDRDDTESRGSRPSLPELHHRQSINNLLNETPGNAAKAVVGRRDSNASEIGQNPDSSVAADIGDDDDDDDVDADAADIDRELAAASLEEEAESQRSQAKKAESEDKTGTSGAKNEPSTAENNKPHKRYHKPRGSDTKAPGGRAAFLGNELEKLQKLKAEKKKPRRYAAPPIWAQEWIPPSQQGHSTNSHHIEAAAAAFAPKTGEAAALSSKPVFNHESMTSTDLECSITGVIPPQSTVRTIAEWLYANFVEISLENRQYVELELKFGTIVNKESGSRIDLGVSTECIFTATGHTRFEVGVHEAGWSEMKNFLEELEKSYADIARKDASKPRRKFSLTESNNTDYFYQITERNEKPKRIRISKDNSLTPPRYVAISKQRVSDLHIHNPSSMYDLRLSLSIEFPVSDESIEPIMKKNKSSMQRGKKRSSYSHAPTVTRFDFTEVSSPKTNRNKAGRSVVENDKSYELELEIDTFQIFRGFDRIRDGSDTIRFEELVEIFLNNARCLNNRVTKFASK
ncbi:hypothetical protein JCM33374_g4220 [Metschnikowia sp. JCM 33374]|nr:hypothetical protein JCM33374_g4220 [Metschnikowia sp. JCM 33374]